MSEDIQDTGNQPVTNEPVPVNETEQRAREMGWVPKEEYIGDPVKWKSAEVFVALDEPIKRIEKQSQEIKQMRAALDAMREHNTKIAETEYNRALKDLREKRKQALVDGDVDTFDKIETEIEKAKEQFVEIKQTQQSPAQEAPVTNPEFRSWLNRNPWYESYNYMRQYADEIGLKFHNQGLDRQEVLKKVEESVKKEFPNRFVNPNKQNAPNLETGSAAKPGKRTESIDLTDQEKNIMNTLVRSGTLTKEEYIAQLKKVKGL